MSANTKDAITALDEMAAACICLAAVLRAIAAGTTTSESAEMFAATTAYTRAASRAGKRFEAWARDFGKHLEQATRAQGN